LQVTLADFEQRRPLNQMGPTLKDKLVKLQTRSTFSNDQESKNLQIIMYKLQFTSYANWL